MPTYQYACTACDERLEAVQSFTDAPLTECPACGGALRKVFSSVGVVFKGSGFYKTDSRASKGAEAGGKEAGDKGQAEKGKSEGGGTGEGGKGDGGKGEKAPAAKAGPGSSGSGPSAGSGTTEKPAAAAVASKSA